MMKLILRYFYVLVLVLCAVVSPVIMSQTYPWQTEPDSTNMLTRRIPPPDGYKRLKSSSESFSNWLQNLPLKPGRPIVHLYNGIDKPNQEAHYRVVNIDVGKRDLQQCADAVIRLRAEYLFSRQNYVDIHFNFTSGDRVNFTSWIQGYRPLVKGNSVIWVKSGEKGASYANFRRYLTQIFLYAGTASLSREMKPVKKIEDMQIGDVFIQGGYPGHAVIVVDMAEHQKTGNKLFMLAQSYMPAQDIHILINPNNTGLSPWYQISFGDILITPEWTFTKSDLKRF